MRKPKRPGLRGHPQRGVSSPVDYKRGKRPHIPQGAYDPERVQLCMQGLILEEHGYRCEEGVLYFAESRERVRIAFDHELRALTKNAIDGLRFIAAGGRIPSPLEDSPKSPRCSLVGICLPDEVNFLKREQTPPRPLAVVRDEALPVYVQARSAKVARKGEDKPDDLLEAFSQDMRHAQRAGNLAELLGAEGQAAASLKPVLPRALESDRGGFPRRHAAASLKRNRWAVPPYNWRLIGGKPPPTSYPAIHRALTKAE